VLITNHVLSGAVIGALSANAEDAFVRGFLSHFALDAVPHFGVDDEHLMKVAVPDGLIGLATIAAIARRTPRDRVVRVLAGITGACLPDLDKPARQFFGRSPFPAWFDRAHAAIQPEAVHRFPVEVATATTCAAALSVLLRRRRSAAGRRRPPRPEAPACGRA
jgi:hypothetical protein